MTKEALKLALEALESVYGKGKRCEAAITAIKEALAQPEHGWTPERIAGMARLKEAQDKKLAQRSFDYKEHAEGLQRDYDLLLAEYNLLKQDLITVVDIEKIVKFKERNS